jgi:predicted regulator of Ras-like GTPase activity (Roadblock/LC7/MglB family)
MDPARALNDLTEISSQIQSAVVVDRDGGVVASTFDDDARASGVARAALELLEAAERVPVDSDRLWLAQLEASTPEGSIFLVRDAERVIAATTAPEPTVGLVFYDLKSCLRAIASEEETPAPQPRQVRTEADGPA